MIMLCEVVNVELSLRRQAPCQWEAWVETDDEAERRTVTGACE
jgi:hypothetical protein